MSTASRPMSRRSVAKGAAWAVPAVSIAAAAPSLAASDADTPCPAVPGWRDIGASLPSFNVVRAADGSSHVSLNIGDITPDLDAPAEATGFRFKPTSVTAVDQDGTVHTGDIRTSTDTAYILGAGGALNVSAIFRDFDYSTDGDGDLDWSDEHRLSSFTVDYTIQWLDGLDIILAGCPFSSTVEVTDFAFTDISGTLSDFR